jgi:lysophospholipase L1-like esterase
MNSFQKSVRIGPAIILALVLSAAFKNRPAKIFLAGDSTVADYSLEDEFLSKRYPVTGWGQMLAGFVQRDSLKHLRNLTRSREVIVDDRAKGGRSTRTFFEEGRWDAIRTELRKGDLVMIQFGHNDAAADKPDRYVTVAGYKEFLRLFVRQAREKGATPILLTPVARNYPWKDGKLGSAHGEYPQAVKDVAAQLNVRLIDLTALSASAFSARGQEYVTSHYFMNLPKGVYDAYPDGQKDNTHFQPEGACEVARLVYEAMKKL